MVLLDLISFFRNEKMPVISPWRNAMYSDGGFAILGQVLARMTGKTFTEAIQEILFDPLGMDSTSTKVPKGSDLNIVNRTAIIGNESSWGVDLEILASYVSSFRVTNNPTEQILTRSAGLAACIPMAQTSAQQA
jgi:CubicO group peptidase (beta-lactamase class C family)